MAVIEHRSADPGAATLTSAPAPAGWNTAFAGSRGPVGDAQRTTVRLALMNKDARTFRFRLTFVGTNNQIHSGAFHETTETILAIAPEA